jgi:hypothetical protein
MARAESPKRKGVEVTKIKSGAKVPMDLKPGEPALGARAPDGGNFLGWVLVQVWEPSANGAGGRDSVVVHWSGDSKALFKRAADELLTLGKG